MRAKGQPRQLEMAALAARQHGVIALRQLFALGFGRGAVRHMLATGRLHRLHQGVFAVGHFHLSARGRWMAAVLACGDGALLSHLSAAILWGIARSGSRRLDVTVVAQGGRSRPGIVVHQVRHLSVDDRAVRERIPITSLARTLLDMAEVVSPRRVERAFEEADRLGLLDVRGVQELCDRSPGRRGLKTLLPLVGERAHPTPDTRSDLEADFAAFCRERELPPPAFNVLVEGFLVDAAWVERKLVVELDSWGFHRTR
jgi:hypothetical protein